MTTRPVTAKQQEATISSAAFPLRFPRMGRELVGKWQLAECVCALELLFDIHFALMKGIAGWIIEVAEFESKIELAHFLYIHGEACEGIRRRLQELRVAEARLPRSLRPRSSRLVRFLREQPDAINFLAAQRATQAGLIDKYREYTECSEPLLDRPSHRLLRQVQGELLEIDDWLSNVIPQYEQMANPNDIQRSTDNSALRIRITSLLNESVGAEPAELDTHYRRTDCRRDARFSTFGDTRNYGTESNALGRPFASGAEGRVFEMVRVQRDEIDAIETFANVLFDFGDVPFEVCMVLARLVEDEARHAEAGQRALEKYFKIDPFAVPCSIIGINVRSPLPPLLAFAQISIFGELSIVGRLKKLADEMASDNQVDFNRFFDFIHADELMHLRRGRYWLEKLCDPATLAELEEEARVAAVRRLHEEGVTSEDYASKLTRQELGELIGE